LKRELVRLRFILIHTIALNLSVRHAMMEAGVCPFMNHLAAIWPIQSKVR
jgi:hypothetical protein